MKEKQAHLIDVNQLRTGMFVELELGWLSHPFPKGSFKISSAKQIETIRGLGLQRVRYVPEKSDPLSLEGSASAADASAPGLSARRETEQPQRREERARLIEAQRGSLLMCERRFGEAVRTYKEIVDRLPAQPVEAGAQCHSLINGFVDEMTCKEELAIRLLSGGTSERASAHSVNVTVIASLLGRAMGLSQNDMVDLGVAALLHDIGKLTLPEQARGHEDDKMAVPEYKVYQEHVMLGVAQVRRMALPDSVQAIIAQHHEKVDGSGFPARLKADQLSLPARILMLVNRYENLCNPGRQAVALTPHEALSLIFAELRSRYDNVVLSAFIRMMGVYPPGSLVQLVDERYALVVSVNSSRPLKPRVIVHDPSIPSHEALMLDLEQQPELGIRRGIKPESLPQEVLAYLFPRQRICYFYEQDTSNPPKAGERSSP